MKKVLLVLPVLLVLLTPSAADATQYSKLRIITLAKDRGVWPAVKAVIQEADLAEEWAACQYITDDYPQFVAATNMLVGAGIATAEDIAYILANSVDEAVPDAALRRVYDKDNTSGTGRVKWHGKKIREEVDMTNMVRITTYEDGTVFRDVASVVTPQDAAEAYLRRIAATTNSAPSRLAAARQRLLKTKTDEANGVVSNVTVNVTAGR